MPLFQVAFGVDNTPRPTLQLSGLDHSALPFDYESVRFDLTLWIVERPPGLRAYWTYSTDLFNPTTITRQPTNTTKPSSTTSPPAPKHPSTPSTYAPTTKNERRSPEERAQGNKPGQVPGDKSPKGRVI